MASIIDLKRNFVINNPAKDYRDKVIGLYDELIAFKISDQMTIQERDQTIRRFMRKVATHVLNCLGEEREQFMSKYMEKYHKKVKEAKIPGPQSLSSSIMYNAALQAPSSGKNSELAPSPSPI